MTQRDKILQELHDLKSALADAGLQNAYQAPAGYFDGLADEILKRVKALESTTAAEELANLSPLLSRISKEMPYSIAGGYFENLQPVVDTKNSGSKAKLVSITSRKWWRYAAAAVVIGFAGATVGLLLLNNKDIDPVSKSYDWVKTNLKNVSTADINEFVEITSTATTDAMKVDAKEETSNLLKDVSDKEIQDFLNDIQASGSAADDDLLFN